jgi:WD40 repeat protein
VTASEDKTARVWNADGTGEPVVLRGHGNTVRLAAFSPDGRCVVIAYSDKTARVWNVDGTGESIVLRGHEGSVRLAAFSSDSRRVVTASDDTTSLVWNADGTGEPVVLLGHEGAVMSAAFSPDGRRVVTASVDKTVRFWHVTLPDLQQALREANVDCLSPPQRQTYLTESEADARRAYEACERSHGRTPFFDDATPP